MSEQEHTSVERLAAAYRALQQEYGNERSLVWLALGRTQLHLFERDLQPTSHHHLE